MSEYIGYIALHRSILDWEWYGDPNARSLFIHCLLSANFKPKKWRGIVINRGQFIGSRQGISQALGISEQQFRTALTKLKSTNDITSKGTAQHTVFTVVNYEKYQNSNQQDNQPPTNEQPTSNQQSTTTNKVNKENNDNNKEIIDFSILNMSDSELQELKRIRKKNKGGALSQRSVNGLAKEFNKAVLMGYTIDDLFTEWETRGWKSFKADWVQPKNTGGNYGHNQQGYRQLSTIERSTQINRAEYERTQREIAELEAQSDYARIVGGFEH